MVINFADVILVAIVYFGVFGSFRGVRLTALLTAAIFFAIVVVTFSSTLVIQGFQRLGVALATPDTQALFTAALFIFTTFMATLVITRIVAMPRRPLTRGEKLWGLLLGFLNGFLIMAVIAHYVSDAAQAAAPAGASVGFPALAFAHPDAATWQVRLVQSSLTLLPPSSNADLWNKLPIALILLLLFLAFVFVGTLYGRVSRSRG